jgi:NADH:ubiquinone oxidoreductase subunit 2 (subunit N)
MRARPHLAAAGAVAALTASQECGAALVVFGAAYAAMNLGAFAVVARVGRPLEAFIGFGRASPWGGGTLVVFLLSLVGVPPLAGFLGKLLLFGAAIDAGFGWLAVVAIANSVLSLGVYLRLIVPSYQAPTAARQAAALGPVPAVSLGWWEGMTNRGRCLPGA